MHTIWLNLSFKQTGSPAFISKSIVRYFKPRLRERKIIRLPEATEIVPLRCAGAIRWRRTAPSTATLAGYPLGFAVGNCGLLGILPAPRLATAPAAAGCAPRGFLKYKPGSKQENKVYFVLDHSYELV
jgi:hypothetical protein